MFAAAVPSSPPFHGLLSIRPRLSPILKRADDKNDYSLWAVLRAQNGQIWGLDRSALRLRLGEIGRRGTSARYRQNQVLEWGEQGVNLRHGVQFVGG